MVEFSKSLRTLCGSGGNWSSFGISGKCDGEWLDPKKKKEREKELAADSYEFSLIFPYPSIILFCILGASSSDIFEIWNIGRK